MKKLLLLALLLALPVQGFAQSFRYTDESGNIFFVDRLDQVPEKYRKQVLGEPTPEFLDPKERIRRQREEERRRKAEAREQERIRKMQEKERLRAQKEEQRRLEREARQAAKNKKTVPVPMRREPLPAAETAPAPTIVPPAPAVNTPPK